MTTEPTEVRPSANSPVERNGPAARITRMLRSRPSRRSKIIAATVCGVVIVSAGSFGGMQLAKADATARLHTALASDAAAHRTATKAAASAAAERADLVKTVEAWTPQSGALESIVGKDAASAVVAALDAARDPQEVAAVPKMKSPDAVTTSEMRLAAAAADTDRQVLTKLAHRISAQDSSYEQLEEKLQAAIDVAKAAVSDTSSATAEAHPAASDEAKAEFARAADAASKDFTPDSVAALAKARTALVSSHEEAQRAAEAEAAAAAQGAPAGQTASGSAGAGRATASGKAPAAAPSRGGSGVGAPGGAKPTPSGGSGGTAPSVGSGGSGGGTGSGGSGSGGGAAPCSVTVVPVKSGAPSGPGTSGSQSGTVGGCSGPVTVRPGIPSNASATVSSSGANWTVNWSVPLPSGWD